MPNIVVSSRNVVISIVLAMAAIVAVASFAGRYRPPRQDPTPNLFVMLKESKGEQTTLVAQGYNWRPGSSIELKVFAEPRRENGEVVSGGWRVVGNNVTADNIGFFGYDSSSAPVFTVSRICGSPPDWLANPFLMARDKANPEIWRLWSLEKSFWFNFKPC